MSTSLTKVAHKFTIEDFLDRSDASEKSKRAYSYQLGQVEKWMGKSLGMASERDLIALLKKLRTLRSGKQYAALVRMFYRSQGRDDAVRLVRIKQRAVRLSPDEILSPGEVQKMIEASTSVRDRCLIATLWDSGVRIHELLALDVGDLKVMESPENGGRKLYSVWFKKTKIRGEEHQGWLIESAPFLDAWLKAHPNPQAAAPLFPSFTTGRRLDPPGALKTVKRTARRAGISKNVWSHLFRHSRATDLLRRGLTEMEVKRLLGWTSSSSMLGRYAHLNRTDDYGAAMKAHGLQPPARVDLEKLSALDELLRPVVPMRAPPGARPVLSTVPEDLAYVASVLRDPEFQHVREAAEPVGKALREAVLKANETGAAITFQVIVNPSPSPRRSPAQ